MSWIVQQTTELNHNHGQDTIWLITNGTKTFSSFYEDWAVWLCNELNNNIEIPLSGLSSQWSEPSKDIW